MPLRTLLAAAALALPPAAGFAQNPAAPQPVAIEFFTSQGCSSCPPADALASRLASEPGLVVLLRPITYWDDLGWHDTLGREENTRLQRDYAAHRLPGGGVFTPEVVVNGRAAAVGSDEAALRGLVHLAQTRQTAALAIAGRPGGLVVGISGQPGGVGDLWLVALRRAVPVVIGRGENSGRTITYSNVVVAERRLTHWAGGTQRVAIPTALLRAAKADRFALLLREAGGGQVLAAKLVPAG